MPTSTRTESKWTKWAYMYECKHSIHLFFLLAPRVHMSSWPIHTHAHIWTYANTRTRIHMHVHTHVHASANTDTHTHSTCPRANNNAYFTQWFCSFVSTVYGTMQTFLGEVAPGNQVLVSCCAVFYTSSFVLLCIRAELARGYSCRYCNSGTLPGANV